MTPVKELHVFDWRNKRTPRSELKPPFLSYLGRSLEARAAVEAFMPRWLRMVDDDAEYVAYFQELLAESPWAKVVGEVTPDYVAISAAMQQQVRALLEGAGFRPVPILVMRDPVDRIWSHFHFRKFHQTEGGLLLGDDLVRAVVESAAARHRRDRTAYEEVLARVEAAYGPDEYFVAFFEEMFQGEELCRLYTMLGVTTEFSQRHVHEHKTSYPSAIPDEVAVEVRRMYASTYDAVSDRFGAERVRRLWRHA